MSLLKEIKKCTLKLNSCSFIFIILCLNLKLKSKMRLFFNNINYCFVTFAIIFIKEISAIQEDPDTLDNGDEGDPDADSHEALYPPPQEIPEDFEAMIRLKRKLDLETELLKKDDYDVETPPRLIRRPSLNGPCHVGHGFQQNPKCYQGQVCVDKITNMKVDCPLPPGMLCSPCTAGSPPSNCPRGCLPGHGCPPLQTGTEDGLCVDPTFASEDYADVESTTLVPPMILRRGLLPYGAPCSSYGDIINQGLVENQEICSWAVARLECISNEPRMPRTSTLMPGQPDRPPGTCKCMLGLGEKAVALPDTNKMGTQVCYIPANKGVHSGCDHEIFLPHGLFEGVKPNGKPYIKSQDAAAKFCVPNSECRAGEKYTGLRCMCKKGAKLDQEMGTCAGGNRIDSGEEPVKFLVIIGIFWIVKINY